MKRVSELATVATYQPAVDRNLYLDVLRGWALVGVCIGNAQIIFFTYGFHVGDKYTLPFGEYLSWVFSHILLQEKYVTLFAVLFGMGVAKMAERRGEKFYLISTVTRMVVLMLMGLLHGMLIWAGDILLVLGVSGLIVLSVARISPLWLTGSALTIYVLLQILAGHLHPLAGTGGALTFEGHQAYLDSEILASSYQYWFQPWASLVSPWSLKVFALVMTGYGLAGIIKDQQLGSRWIFCNPWKAFLIAGTLGTAVSVLGIAYLAGVEWGREDPWRLGHNINNLAAPFFSAGIALAVYLAFRRWPAAMVGVFAKYGRTTMSNYLLFNAVAVGFLWGFDLFGIPVWQSMVIALLIIALQIYMTRLWLDRFRHGPTEWIWREASKKLSISVDRLQQALIARSMPAFQSGKHNQWIPAVQYLALATMTIDHLLRYVPEAPIYNWYVFTLGRWAFPMFAAMMAWHLYTNTRNKGRYLWRVLMLATVSHPVYTLVTGSQLATPENLNILFTLSAGIFLVVAIDRLLLERSLANAVNWKWLKALEWVTLPWAIMGVFMVATAVDYGASGVILVPAFYWVFRGAIESRTIVLIMGLLALGFSLYHLNPPWLPQLNSLAAGFFMLALASGVLRIPKLPVMPRWLWLCWYPGHLALIALMSFFTS